MVDAVAHIDIKTPWLTKERFVAGGAAAVAVAGGVVLGIRLRFHNRAPQEVAIGLAFHQKATDEVGSNLLGRTAEEGVREGLGKGGGYGSGLGMAWKLLGSGRNMRNWHKARIQRNRRVTRETSGPGPWQH